jgi:hypothetical protein
MRAQSHEYFEERGKSAVVAPPATSRGAPTDELMVE